MWSSMQRALQIGIAATFVSTTIGMVVNTPETKQLNPEEREQWLARLQIAARDGNLEVVKELLPEVNANRYNCDGDNVLHIAARYGQAEVVQLLVDIYLDNQSVSKNPNIIDDIVDIGSRLLSGAKRIRGIDDINQFNLQGESALCLAKKADHENIVEILLRAGARPIPLATEEEEEEEEESSPITPMLAAILKSDKPSKGLISKSYRPSIF